MKSSLIVFTFFALALLAEAGRRPLDAVWSQVTPIRAAPQQVNKPNLIEIDGLLYLLNGVHDDCNTQTTTFLSNSVIYEYDPRTNIGRFINATGDIPDTRLFASQWRAGKDWMFGGGVFYNVQFTIIDFKSYNPLYRFSIEKHRDRTMGRWTAVIPTGTVPSPRTEMSVVENLQTSNEVYLFGGVTLGATGFQSFGEVYRYTINANRFDMIHAAFNPDDGSLGPKSRYHAHIFWYARGHTEEFEIHQGVHGTAAGLEELTDSWRFNVRTFQWRQIFPNPMMDEVRRHGANWQMKIRGQDYFCTALGDRTHTSSLVTLGCLFDIDTINNTICNNPDDNHGNGAWFQVATTGPILRTKYPGFTAFAMDKKVYLMAGEREDPFNATYNIQVWDDGVRILDFS